MNIYILLFYSIALVTIYLIINNNHLGSKIISFFVFIIFISTFLLYVDIKFLAFIVLLWYGRRLTATFVIMCEYMSARKFEKFFSKASSLTIKDLQFMMYFIIAMSFLCRRIQLFWYSIVSRFDMGDFRHWTHEDGFDWEGGDRWWTQRNIFDNFERYYSFDIEIDLFMCFQNICLISNPTDSIRNIHSSLCDNSISQTFLLWIFCHLFVYIIYFVIITFTYKYRNIK